MRNITLSLRELYENRNKFIVLLIQITIALIVFSYTFGMLSNSKRIEDVCQKINGSNLYILKDVTSKEHVDNEILRGNKEDIENKLNTFFFEMMNSDDYNALTIINTKSKKNENLLYISEKYNQVFTLNFLDGGYFDFNDSSNSYIPIITGFNFRDAYALGQIIDNKYIVVGMLNKGNYYLELKNVGAVISLDDYIILPVNKSFFVDIPEYDVAINRTFIYSDSVKSIEEIIKYSSQLNLYDFEYINYNDQKEYILSDIQEIISLLSIVFILVSMFSVVNIIASLTNYINNKAREHMIHFLCGATIYNLVIRLVLQVIIVITLCNIISAFVLRENYQLLPLIVVSIIVIISIVILPVVKLLRLKIYKVISLED